MKILCFLLSISLFSLSVVPCCTDDNCNDDKVTEQSENHSKEHQENNCKTCSPFFTCGTCSGFVFAFSDFDFRVVSTNKDKFTDVYKSQFIDGFFAKIWQPPKIKQ